MRIEGLTAKNGQGAPKPPESHKFVYPEKRIPLVVISRDLLRASVVARAPLQFNTPTHENTIVQLGDSLSSSVGTLGRLLLNLPEPDTFFSYPEHQALQKLSKVAGLLSVTVPLIAMQRGLAMGEIPVTAENIDGFSASGLRGFHELPAEYQAALTEALKGPLTKECMDNLPFQSLSSEFSQLEGKVREELNTGGNKAALAKGLLAIVNGLSLPEKVASVMAEDTEVNPLALWGINIHKNAEGTYSLGVLSQDGKSLAVSNYCYIADIFSAEDLMGLMGRLLPYAKSPWALANLNEALQSDRGALQLEYEAYQKNLEVARFIMDSANTVAGKRSLEVLSEALDYSIPTTDPHFLEAVMKMQEDGTVQWLPVFYAIQQQAAQLPLRVKLRMGRFYDKLQPADKIQRYLDGTVDRYFYHKDLRRLARLTLDTQDEEILSLPDETVLKALHTFGNYTNDIRVVSQIVLRPEEMTPGTYISAKDIIFTTIDSKGHEHTATVRKKQPFVSN